MLLSESLRGFEAWSLGKYVASKHHCVFSSSFLRLIILKGSLPLSSAFACPRVAPVMLRDIARG